VPSLTPVIKQPLERFPVRVPLIATPATVDASSVTARGLVPEVTPLTIVSATPGADFIDLLIEGGTAGELYALQARGVTAGGNRYEGEVEVLVLDLSFRGAGATAAAYLSIPDFIARVGIDEAIRLTDDKGTGAIDAARLDAALRDAEGVINSYLVARYAVPLAAPVPAPIPTLTFDLALARLYSGEPPEGVTARRDAALAHLKLVAEGKAGLPIAVAPTPVSPAPVMVAPAERLFTRQSMRGF
jgi:phage gp36-like protein